MIAGVWISTVFQKKFCNIGCIDGYLLLDYFSPATIALDVNGVKQRSPSAGVPRVGVGAPFEEPPNRFHKPHFNQVVECRPAHWFVPEINVYSVCKKLLGQAEIAIQEGLYKLARSSHLDSPG